MPPRTSVMRGLGLPGHGSAAHPLVVMAPRRETSKKFWNCQPNPKVPEAVLMGFLSCMPAKSTAMDTLLTRRPP